MADLAGPLSIAARVGATLTAVGARYLLGGSLGASVFGEPRYTNDIDIATDLKVASIDAFAAALGDDFEVDVDSLREAFQVGKSWNIFFLSPFSRIDLFPARGSEYDDVALGRAVAIRTADGKQLSVAAPEDSILRKLRWFRDGGEVSHQQWRDVLGVLRNTGERIDVTYLERWAPELGVEDLLARARSEAARP